MKTTSSIVPVFLAAAVWAQQPAGQTPAPQAPAAEAKPLAAPERVPGGTWVDSEGYGPGRADALANALELAIQQVHGVSISKCATLRARLSVATRGDENRNTDGVLEVGRVAQQLEGFVAKVETPRYAEVKDGWQARVRCLVADYDPKSSDSFVVQLVEVFGGDSGEQTWQVQDLDQETGRTSTTVPAKLCGSELQERLQATNRIKISAAGNGVRVSADSDRTEAAKQGHALVASHRIEVRWRPVTFDLMTTMAYVPGGARNRVLNGATLHVEILMRDLVQQKEMVKAEFDVPVTVEKGTAYSEETRQRLAQSVLAAAYDAVVMKLYFALRPPIVLDLKKTEGDAPKWIVEADIPYDFAAQIADVRPIEFGVDTAVGQVRWKSHASAHLLPGKQQLSRYTASFVLDPGSDPDRIVPGTTRMGIR